VVLTVTADLRAGGIFNERRGETISVDDIGKARAAARSTRRRIVDVLEERPLLPRTVSPRASRRRFRSSASTGALRRAAPQFDLLSFNECRSAAARLRAEDGSW